jgi:hypothetical protein
MKKNNIRTHGMSKALRIITHHKRMKRRTQTLREIWKRMMEMITQKSM